MPTSDANGRLPTVRCEPGGCEPGGWKPGRNMQTDPDGGPAVLVQRACRHAVTSGLLPESRTSRHDQQAAGGPRPGQSNGDRQSGADSVGQQSELTKPETGR